MYIQVRDVISLAAAALCGFFVAELCVYGWHRWVCHAGLLRRFANDLFRRRHFHHHVEQYPPDHLRADLYVASCDIAFRAVAMLLLTGVAGAAAMRWVATTVMIAAVVGMAFHGWLGAKIHELCHVGNEVARQWPLLRFGITFRVYERLRRFHDGHHSGHGNYSLLIPAVDVLARTSIRRDSKLSLQPAELFPGFPCELSSSCGQALF